MQGERSDVGIDFSRVVLLGNAAPAPLLVSIRRFCTLLDFSLLTVSALVATSCNIQAIISALVSE